MNAPLSNLASVADFAATPEVESRRTIANRLNAQKSTGPRTEEGKERSRRNAVKHGLSGSGKCVPVDMEEEARIRVEEWTGSLNPKDGVERDLVELGATAMTQVRRCWREEGAARKRAVMRAERVWESDRRTEVARKVGRLAKNPARVSAELRGTRFGAEWMVEQWRELGVRLEAGKAWTEAQRSLALDLLGVAPEFRDELTRVDFPGLEPREADDARRRLVARQVEVLEAEIDADLADLDEEDRMLRVDDIAIIGDAEVNRLRRYERTLSHRVLTVLATLRKGPATPDETKPIAPAVEASPPAVTLPTEPISAMQVAPTLLPPPDDREPATPDDYREWLRSRTDSDVETMLLPLLMGRLASMQAELAEQLGVDATDR